ncbi:MAG: isoprenoid biosynthesis glyoxalase ElbB [Pseudomonadota bacterium]|mgnify:FL=1
MHIALILAGCGQQDGSEIQEVVLTLLSLAQAGVSWDAFAPDIHQLYVINHLTGKQEVDESRNVLTESARVVRGKIKPITAASVADYDAIIFPGGIGAVTNLCDWRDKGKEFSFNPDVKQFIDAAVSQQKPMGFMCIAPMMIPKIWRGAKLTIGHDTALANQIVELGSAHVNCSATDIVVDENHRIVSTPANMVARSIEEVYEGIHKLVEALMKMVSK